MSKLAYLSFAFTIVAGLFWTFNGATLLGLIAFATFSILALRKPHQGNQ
jgi:hypothetical protein